MNISGFMMKVEAEKHKQHETQYTCISHKDIFVECAYCTLKTPSIEATREIKFCENKYTKFKVPQHYLLPCFSWKASLERE